MINLSSQLEFHRLGVGLVPAADDTSRGSAIHIPQLKTRPLRSCTCPASRKKTCRHLKQLSVKLRDLDTDLLARPWLERFEASLWYRLAKLLFLGEDVAVADCQVVGIGRRGRAKKAGGFAVTRADGAVLARYLESSPAALLLLERLGKASEDRVDRARLLERLAMFQATAQERHFAKHGMKTHRQKWEESFWHRMAYHAVREHGGEGTFHPSIDRRTGDFTLGYEVGGPADDRRLIVQLTVPRIRVKVTLELLRDHFPEQADLAIHPVPLKSIFRITQDTEIDLEVRPVIEAIQASGEARFFARKELARFRYGNLVYIPELKVLAELERRGKERKFAAPRSMRLARSQVPTFLAEHAEAIADGSLVLDPVLGDLRILRTYDSIEITPGPAAGGERGGQHSLTVRYRFDGLRVGLSELLRAKAAHLPFLEIENGWIDLGAPDLVQLEQFFSERGTGGEQTDIGDRVRLSASQVLRAFGASGKPVKVAGGKASARQALERVLALRPASRFEQPAGLATSLRPYQVLGAEWLRFLWENRLPGLLADDMGLGKTHQAMALMASIREQGEGASEPILVVCPTSVLSHWQTKIRDHAPGLGARLHHGPQRDARQALANADVLITSYGVLRRDIEQLEKARFALVVFDEIQHLKNRATVSHEAASRLDARIKLGLTGTPIENSLTDLKALFDLLLPGYLGSDAAFADRYVAAEGDLDGERKQRLAELRRITAPFILRRLKSTVLDELPEKIENVYTCQLSDDQLALYREVIEERGGPIAAKLRGDTSGRLPYIHIFALLNLLKQICDHPALALKDLDAAERYASGKWDVFRELLDQSLESGQKVVVFSQYLGMIELMSRHLEARAIGHGVLTGSTVDRGRVIDRFNTEVDCRVFLGSLKAGGTGIDLVGGSVVIHYDRWWNAAREDQATDRVHRIGQDRQVHVIKLVTTGTLEERIADIIDRKRRLADAVVKEDDPTLAKIFTRDELLALLRPV